MAEKQETSPYRESNSCSVRFVYPVSFVSLLICITALVRVEIINQRVHTVEELVAEVGQTTNRKLTGHAASFNTAEKVKAVDEFDRKNTREWNDATEGNAFLKTFFNSAVNETNEF